MEAKHQSKSVSFISEFIFGGAAAFISKSIASPIEVVKLRLQVQQALLEKGVIAYRYEGIADCFKRLYVENGLPAFFKGNATNALRFFLTQALNFSFRDLFRKVIEEQRGAIGFKGSLLAGGAAGAITQTMVYPLDFARTRLANQAKSGKTGEYLGLLDCIRKTLRSDGVEGLYRGFAVSCMCMVIYRGLYFGIYDSLRPRIPKKVEQNMAVTFGLGYLAAIVSGAVSYPLDTVRRRMMMTSGEAVKFSGTLSCVHKIYAEGGFRGFFRGGTANVVGGVTGAAVFSIYDRMKVEFGKKHRV
jgi:solute carrier family 25 (adenine nucleotide translocator) protein 4/5/6/31